MKVLVITYKKNVLWAKTANEITKRLSRYDDIEVDTLDWNIPNHIWCLVKFIQKPFFNNSYDGQDVFFRPLGAFFLKRIMTQRGLLHFDVYLFICHYVAIPFVSGKIYQYVDATLPTLYPFLRSKKKLLSKYILSKYISNKIKDYKTITKIFTQNEYTQLSTIDDFKVSKSKVINVRFGINLEAYRGTKDYRNHLLLIVLRKGVERLKGLNLLLDTMPLVIREIPDVHLAIVGTEGKKQPNITYYFEKGREKTVELFRKASLYIMPALHEPNGVTYLEALANRTPIVGLNRFAFPEFSGNGRFGFVCNSQNPQELSKIIVSALSNENLLNKMGKEGQEFVEQNYTWDRVMSIMYNELH